MKTPFAPTPESETDNPHRRQPRRRPVQEPIARSYEFAARLRPPALYRLDTTAEETADDSPATFSERERRRTLQVAARLAAGELQSRLRRVSLNGLLEDLRRQFLPYALSRRIAFSVGAPERPVSCLASEEMLKAMTRALIWNALECVPAGAVVRVAATVDQASQTAKIEIRDNGPLVAPEDWENLDRRLRQVAKPSDLFDLPRPEYALAMQLAELSGISLVRRDRPATCLVEATIPSVPGEEVLSRLALCSAATGARMLSAFSLNAVGVSAEDAIVVEEIALGSLAPNSMLWRTRIEGWFAVAPASPLEWFDWYRQFAAALHLEGIRAGRRFPTPDWTYHGAWPTSADETTIASLMQVLTSEQEHVESDSPSRRLSPAVTVPMPEFCRVDEAQEALRLLGYRRFRQEASEWGEVRIVAERT